MILGVTDSRNRKFLKKFLGHLTLSDTCTHVGARGLPKRNITRIARDYHRSSVIVAHRVGHLLWQERSTW